VVYSTLTWLPFLRLIFLVVLLGQRLLWLLDRLEMNFLHCKIGFKGTVQCDFNSVFDVYE
jgi:hypothetical protein